MISDYFQMVEKNTSETRIIAERAIDFREFDIDEGLLKGKILSLTARLLNFWNI